jgi:uncharacterized protein YegL
VLSFLLADQQTVLDEMKRINEHISEINSKNIKFTMDENNNAILNLMQNIVNKLEDMDQKTKSEWQPMIFLISFLQNNDVS